MRSRRTAASLGEALEHCLYDAKHDWFEEFKAGRPADYAWTQDTVTTHLDSQLKHGGRITVLVSIICKEPYKSTVTMFYLQRKNKHEFLRVRDSLDIKGR